MSKKNPYFKFRIVDTFNRDMNRRDCFDLLDMNGTDLNFKLVLASKCSPNIADCLDDDGTLMEYDSTTNKGVQILQTLGEDDGLIPLLCNYGVNGEITISVSASTVVYDLTDGDKYIEGIFLTSYVNGSGYVLAYSINNAPLHILDDTLILNIAGMAWG